MALREQLSAEELALVEIVEDEVWLGEFLRSTRDGSMKRDEWPSRPFEYRWYQKDLMTDRNEYIVLTAGRAVGKCQPSSARIYTSNYGYRLIADCLELQNRQDGVYLYCIDPKTQKLIQRRAAFTGNGYQEVYRLTTDSGFVLDATGNHPVLTRRGYIMFDDLQSDDEVAVVTKLPPMLDREPFSWEELRWFGYFMAEDANSVECEFKVKSQAQVADFKRIADYFGAKFKFYGTTIILRRAQGPLPHYGTKLLRETGYSYVSQSNKVTRFSPHMRSISNAQMKILLEAYFSYRAEITPTKVTFTQRSRNMALDMQEMLLRFGIETTIALEEDKNHKFEDVYRITLRDEYAYWLFFTTFDLPGVTVRNLIEPMEPERALDYLRFEPIRSIVPRGRIATIAITVRDAENYISDNVFVHNSLVMEDKIVYETVNEDKEFPETKEQTLVTANVAQMTPILDRVIMRFMSSPLLKGYANQFNRSKGTLDFKTNTNGNYRLNARIAGSRGEANMVGLHVPRIKGDEMQIFPMSAYIQLRPTYNGWEHRRQQFYCGVPNGGREGNVLYFMDQRSAVFKKYRIPATENPYWTNNDHIEAIKQYGGEESDDFQRLVLGKHGDVTVSMIPRDKIVTEPFEFYSYRYSQTDKHNGKDFRQMLRTHKLPANIVSTALAIDTGYADPTIANVMGKDEHGVWRTYARYRLTRIPFPEQADVIDYLDNAYNFHAICVDLGAGGGGIGLMQDLQSGRFSKAKKYSKRIHGVQFSSSLETGEDAEGNALKMQAKSFAGIELARLVTEGQVRFSEIDMEGVSQLERVSYQRRADGTNQYFIISERGSGKSEDDHIFASYLVFVLMLLTVSLYKPRTKLFTARWM
jgi:LAGLIDADG-like domain